MSKTKSAESVASLVVDVADLLDGLWLADKSDYRRVREYADQLREAASRLSSPAKDPLSEFCQSEGPRGETICMMPLGHKGKCGWEKLS